MIARLLRPLDLLPGKEPTYIAEFYLRRIKNTKYGTWKHLKKTVLCHPTEDLRYKILELGDFFLPLGQGHLRNR